jgi:hypothetical protein
MIFEALQTKAENFLYRKEIAKNAEALISVLREIRALIPEQEKIWLETAQNYLYINSLEQKTLIIRALTEKKAPGFSDDFPLSDYVHPTMLYRMSAHFNAAGEPEDFEFVPPLPDRKKLEFTKMGPFMKQLLMGTTRVVTHRFHFPPQPDETMQFTRLMPLMLVELQQLVSLLRENAVTAKQTSDI